MRSQQFKLFRLIFIWQWYVAEKVSCNHIHSTELTQSFSFWAFKFSIFRNIDLIKSCTKHSRVGRWHSWSDNRLFNLSVYVYFFIACNIKNHLRMAINQFASNKKQIKYLRAYSCNRNYLSILRHNWLCANWKRTWKHGHIVKSVSSK